MSEAVPHSWPLANPQPMPHTPVSTVLRRTRGGRSRAVPSRSTPDLPDAELVARCQAGNEAAWTLLVQRHEGLVYSTALSLGLGEEDAADVFQQVWVQLHQSLPRLRNPQGLVRWLIVATRREGYRVSVQRRRLASGVSRDHLDPSSLPDEMVEGAQARQRLESSLRRLGEKCERLLRLLFLSDAKIPYDEIARSTGLAIGSIGPIRSRCLTRLRSLMEDRT